MALSASIFASDGSDGLTLRAEGNWLVATAAELDRHLHGLQLPQGRRVTLDLAGVERLDTAGAWLLLRFRRVAEYPLQRDWYPQVRKLIADLISLVDDVKAQTMTKDQATAHLLGVAAAELPYDVEAG